MSYRIGIVKKTEPGGYAQVMTERKTACGECYHNRIVCYGCLLSPKIVSRVANPIGSGVGDMVKIYLSAGKLYTAAGMFYLLPIFTLLLGAFSGIYVSETFGRVARFLIFGQMTRFLISLTTRKLINSPIKPAIDALKRR